MLTDPSLVPALRPLWVMALSFKNEVALTLLLRSEADICRRVVGGETVNGGEGTWRGPQHSEDTGSQIHDRVADACQLTGLPAVAKGDEGNEKIVTCRTLACVFLNSRGS